MTLPEFAYPHQNAAYCEGLAQQLLPHFPSIRYDVICPSAPWENTTTDEDRAWDLCLSLSEEYGYAQVRCNGVIIGDYTDGQ